MKDWELLEQKGWCQGTMRDSLGRICAFQAFVEIYGFDSLEQYRLYHEIPWPISIWNDAPGRTKAEVIAALKAADV